MGWGHCRLWPIVDVLMPISFLQPILTFALVWSNGWEKWNASYWDSLVVSAPLVAARCELRSPLRIITRLWLSKRALCHTGVM